MKKFARAVLHGLLAFVVLSAPFVFTGCPEKQNPDAPPLTPEQAAEKKRKDAEEVLNGLAVGLAVGAEAIEPGVELVRAWRLAGKVSPETSRKLAKYARAYNVAADELAAFLIGKESLGESDVREFSGLVGRVLAAARRLQSEGAVELDGEQAVAFQLGALAAQTGLSLTEGRLKQFLGGGLVVRLSPEARAGLAAARARMRQNTDILKTAVERLPN